MVSPEVPPPKALEALRAGDAATESGELDTSVGHYKDAIRLKADYGEAYYKLAHALYRKGDYDSALPYLAKYIRLAPKDVNGLWRVR